MSKSEWVIEGVEERLCVFPGQDGNWMTTKPFPCDANICIHCSSLFSSNSKQHLSPATDYFSLPNWWWADICISSTKTQASEAYGPEKIYVVGGKRE